MWMGGIHLVEKTATLDQRESRREEWVYRSKISKNHSENEVEIGGTGDEGGQKANSLILAPCQTLHRQ
jgi:hypothetical protein